jgi:hypothetical protein
MVVLSAEREHIAALLQKHKNNLKKYWSIINSILGRKQPSNIPSQLLIDGARISDPLLIANAFNDFFSDIANQLAQQLPVTATNPIDFLDEPNPYSIFIAPTDTTEVNSLVRSLKSSSPGWDSFSADVIKAAVDSFIIPLTHVMNLSLSNGVVPSYLKIAKVTPIHKGGDDQVLSN